MTGRYLTDLDDVVRGAGLPCILVDGWETRARSSGGYSSGRPTAVMVHHTASGPSSDGWPDVNYMVYSSENRPVSNLYINRSGQVWVMAAGCTNTNGKGHDYWGGGVPDDSMNSYAIGIEAGNAGTGEPWARAQQDAYVKLCAALCHHYGISVGNCRGHFEWAPDRKVDPLGPSDWAQGAVKWNMDAYRGDVATGGGSGPAPGPPPGKDEKMYAYLQDEKGNLYLGDYIQAKWLSTVNSVNIAVLALTVAGLPAEASRTTSRDILDGAFGVLTGPKPGNI